MLQALGNFDPVSFLGVDTVSLSSEEISQLRNSLNTKMGEYILLKFSENLTDEQFQQITNTKDGEQMITMLKNIIPNLEEKMLKELESFKREYQLSA